MGICLIFVIVVSALWTWWRWFRKSPKKLRDEVILLTGATGALGKLLAKKFASEQAKLILTDLNQEALEEFAATLNTETFPIACDLTDRNSISIMIDKIFAKYGSLDILVNNAGYVAGRLIEDLQPEQIDRCFKVNIISHFDLIKAFLPGMLNKDKGHIVSIASAGGLASVPYLTDYCASKAAAISLDEGLRFELKQKHSNVKTTCCCPYFMKGEMFSGVNAKNPLMPILTYESVANVCFKAIVLENEMVYWPLTVYAIHLLKMLPIPLSNWIVDFLGPTSAMSTFNH